jgi:hypothetical protein
MLESPVATDEMAYSLMAERFLNVINWMADCHHVLWQYVIM